MARSSLFVFAAVLLAPAAHEQQGDASERRQMQATEIENELALLKQQMAELKEQYGQSNHKQQSDLVTRIAAQRSSRRTTSTPRGSS